MSLIVFAEDDHHVGLLVEYTLQSKGYQVERFLDGEQVWERLQAEPRPDVIVLDIMMPGLSGFDVLELVQARPELAPIPVMVLSARARDVDRNEATRRGAREFMAKPFDIDELADKVTAMLAGDEEE